MSQTDLYLSVAGVLPRIGWDQDVSLRPTIQVRFNTPLNDALVNTDPGINSYVVLVRLNTDDITGVDFVAWDATTRILAFRPKSDLAPGAVYQVTLRRELQTAQGRRMAQDYSWSFQTARAPVGTVTLRLPGDATAFGSAPTLEWDGVWAPSGSITYRIQVHRDWQFVPPVLWESTQVTATTGGVRTAAIGASLTAGTAYYWRVRAETAACTGDWSETRSFYLGSTEQAAPDSTYLYQPERPFFLEEFLPENRLPNQGSWPTIQATFTQPLSGASLNERSFYLEAFPVDGRAGNAATAVSGTITVQGAVATFTPATDIRRNTLYRFTVTKTVRSSGNTLLGETQQFFFTSNYLPLYGGVEALRADLGGFLGDKTDDDLFFQLWRQSLRLNELIATENHRIQRQLTVEDLVGLPIAGGITYGMQRIAEVGGAITLLEGFYGDMLRRAGRTGSLATFQFTVSVELLAEIRKRIDELQDELEELEAAFIQNVVVCRTTRKGEFFPTTENRRNGNIARQHWPDVDWSRPQRRQF